VTLPVLTAVTGAWEAPLVAGLERSSRDVRVVRRCVDVTELLAAAQAGLARAVVISADLHRLDRESVLQLEAAGLAVVGISDPSDPESALRLAALGVERNVPGDASAEAVVELVTAAVDELATRGAADAHRGDGAARRTVLAAALRPVADPADALGWPAALRADPDAPGGFGVPGGRPAGPGRLVAVWGPAGAPGRTTVAVTLAGELTKLDERVLLADADTYAASVAQVLGLLDESAGLAAAVRAANSGALDLHRMARLAPIVSPGLRVLTGLPRAQRWPELRPSGLDVVWELSRRLASVVVVDCGFGLEADEEITFDTAAPRRNQATLSALAAADEVVAVGSADPVGLQRLIRGLQDLAGTIPPGRTPRVVVTRVRASAVGADPYRRITEALARYAGVRDPVLVPDDRPAADAALLAGRSLSEHAPGSPATAAIAQLAAALAGVAAGRRRNGGRRGRG
jgi:MinD-like ATPase involved in chromosome partitioning or flagellar assembly